MSLKQPLQECRPWVRANDRVVFPWLAIDDRSWLYRPFNRSLFLVDGKTGMTAANAEALVERLRSLQHCQTEVRGLRTAPGWLPSLSLTMSLAAFFESRPSTSRRVSYFRL